jgi:hypothetical protein
MYPCSLPCCSYVRCVQVRASVEDARRDAGNSCEIQLMVRCRVPCEMVLHARAEARYAVLAEYVGGHLVS